MSQIRQPRERQPGERRGGENAFAFAVQDVLVTLGLVLLTPVLLYRMALQGKYREGLGQRLGCLPRWERRTGGCIWVHGVSVGEILAARHLIARLGEEFPGRPVVLSTTTVTGQAVARQQYPEHVVFYYPLDLSWVVRRVLSQLRPALLVLLELEVWPTMLRLAERQGLPVVVVNGRLSPRSFRFYSSFGRLRFGFLNRVRMYGVQDAVIAERMRQLGIATDRIRVTGSLKHDTVQEQGRPSPEVAHRLRERLQVRSDQPVLVLGSTHPSEARLLAPVLARLREGHPDLAVVWAPRHPERLGVVEEALRGQRLTWRRLSELDGPSPPSAAAVCIVDTVGELARLYALATVVFVGKSLGSEHGGQNMLEPAALGRPVAVGPHTGNFPNEVAHLRAHGGLAVVQDAGELEQLLDRWLRDAPHRRQVGQAAQHGVGLLRGGSEACLAIIREALAEGRRDAGAGAPAVLPEP